MFKKIIILFLFIFSISEASVIIKNPVDNAVYIQGVRVTDTAGNLVDGVVIYFNADSNKFILTSLPSLGLFVKRTGDTAVTSVYNWANSVFDSIKRVDADTITIDHAIKIGGDIIKDFTGSYLALLSNVLGVDTSLLKLTVNSTKLNWPARLVAGTNVAFNIVGDTVTISASGGGISGLAIKVDSGGNAVQLSDSVDIVLGYGVKGRINTSGALDSVFLSWDSTTAKGMLANTFLELTDVDGVTIHLSGGKLEVIDSSITLDKLNSAVYDYIQEIAADSAKKIVGDTAIWKRKTNKDTIYYVDVSGDTALKIYSQTEKTRLTSNNDTINIQGYLTADSLFLSLLNLHGVRIDSSLIDSVKNNKGRFAYNVFDSSGTATSNVNIGNPTYKKGNGIKITISGTTATFSLGVDSFWVNAALYPGMNVNDTISDQTAMDNLINSSYKVIYFPPGIYRATLNNRTSYRTFIFADSAIIDGVFHFAIGDSLSDMVSHVTIIGRAHVTERAGCYFASDVNADGIVMMPIDTLYRTQAANGQRGIHIYQASKDMNLGNVEINGSNAIYGLGIDINTDTSAAYRPTNIKFTSITIDDADSSAIRLAYTVDVSLGVVNIKKYHKKNGLHLYKTKRTKGYITNIDASSTITSGLSGIWIESDSGSYFNNTFINTDTVTNSGITVTGSIGGTGFGDITLISADTVGSKFGLDIENSTNVRANYVSATGYKQGIRIFNGNYISLKSMFLVNNHIGFTAGGTNNVFTFDEVTYVGNTNNYSGTAPENMTNVRGPLPSPAGAQSGLYVKGSGNTGTLVNPGFTPSSNYTSGTVRLVATNINQAQGPSILFGNVISGQDRLNAAIKTDMYTALDSGLVNLTFGLRLDTLSDSIQRVGGFIHNGSFSLGIKDTSNWFSFPTTRPTTSGYDKVLAWGNTSAGIFRKIFDSVVYVDSGSGIAALSHLVLSEGNNVDITVSGDTVFIGASASAIESLIEDSLDEVWALFGNYAEIDGDTLSGTYDFSSGYIEDVNKITPDTVSTTILQIGGDSFDELVGTGLQIVSGDLQTTLGTSISSSEIDDNTISMVNDLATFSSANFFNRLTDGTGATGVVVGSISPTLTGTVLTDTLRARQLRLRDTVDGSNDLIQRVGNLSSNLIISWPTSLSTGIMHLASSGAISSSAVTASELASTTGSGSTVVLSSSPTITTPTFSGVIGADSSNFGPTKIATSNINFQGIRAVLPLTTVHFGHYAGNWLASLSADSNFIWSQPSTMFGQMSDTATPVLVKCSSLTVANLPAAKRATSCLIAGIATQKMYIDSIKIYYEAGSSTTFIQLDSFKLVIYDTTSAPGTTRSPAMTFTYTTDIGGITQTSAKIDVDGIGGNELIPIYAGSMVKFWPVISCDTTTGSDRTFMIEGVEAIGRYR